MDRKNIAISHWWGHRSTYVNYVDNGSDNDNVGDQQSRILSMSGPNFSFHLDANIVDNVDFGEEIKHANVVGEEIGVDLKRKGKALMNSEQPTKKQNLGCSSGPSIPSESFPKMKTENIGGSSDKAIDQYSHLKGKNIVPTENEKVLLDLTGFIFRSSTDDDQSELLSNQFFCTQEAKHDVRNEESPTNADLKKKIDGEKEGWT